METTLGESIRVWYKSGTDKCTTCVEHDLFVLNTSQCIWLFGHGRWMVKHTTDTVFSRGWRWSGDEVDNSGNEERQLWELWQRSGSVQQWSASRLGTLTNSGRVRQRSERRLRAPASQRKVSDASGEGGDDSRTTNGTQRGHDDESVRRTPAVKAEL